MSVLQDELEALKVLNRSRYDYVLARSDTSSIQAALDVIGLTRGWYYRFDEDERGELERMSSELHYAKTVKAQLLLEQAAVEAATVKVSGLHSRNEDVRQRAASDILDRLGVKADQRTVNEQTGKVEIVVRYVDPD